MKLFLKVVEVDLFPIQDAAVVLSESCVKTTGLLQTTKEQKDKGRKNKSDNAEHLFFQNIFFYWINDLKGNNKV